MDNAADILAGTTGVAAPDIPPNPDAMQPQSALPDQAVLPAQGGTPADPRTLSPGPVSQDPNTPSYTPVIPSETMPRNPDVERTYHESKWRQILDRVGTILGGGDTVHITKDADGNISEIHMPSTGSEKWGRVAAAALGGAAQGLANSQGPGGLAKAASAGIQYGLNVPKQEQENIDAQATAEQKRMQANANHAMTQQDLMQKMLISNQLKTTVNQQSADLMNAYSEQLRDSPNSKDYGVISSMDDLTKIAAANQHFLHDHTNLVLKTALVPKAGGGTEIHAIATDPGDDARNVGPNDQLLQISVDPKTHEPTLTSEKPSSTEKKGKLRAANQTILAQFAGLSNKWTDTQTKAANAAKEKVPGNYEQAYGMAAQTNDPAEKQRYTALGDQLFEKATRLKSITNIKNVLPSNPQSITNWGDLLADPKSGATLANVQPKELRNAVVNDMASRGLKMAKPLSSAELNRADLAGNALSNIEQAQAIMERRQDMFGPGGFMKTKFRQAFEGGDPDAQAFMTAISLANLPLVGIHGMRGKYAVEDLSKFDSNLYNNPESMRNILNEIHRSASEFADSGGRKIETPAPAKTGGGTPPPAAGGGGANPPAAAPPHAPAVRDAKGVITPPPGATPGYRAGKLIGYQDANGWHE